MCGSQTRREKVSVNAVCVRQSKILLSSAIRNLGLIIDAGVTMQDHISNTESGCFYHLRSLDKLCPFLSARAASAIAVSMVFSRIDCNCNNCLWGVPSQQLKCLQLVQNTVTRTVTCTQKREHIIPVLKELLWLPVRKRIDQKIMPLAYKCFEGMALEYLLELIL